MGKAKPFEISKQVVLEAYKRVKANRGSAGVDGESIKAFEDNLQDNLYKLWNRMSSGTYFPPPVLEVGIPKKDGGVRKLGIPTVADRIAQMVVKLTFEPQVESIFLPDSYGYRPRKSALDAIGKARQRCWKYDWVLDLDIEGFFDNLDHELLMKAVRKNTDCKWVLLYVERWLKASIQDESGACRSRTCGTPQGGVISPLLANLFLHYALDVWINKHYPHNPYERYADDQIVHCKTKQDAINLKEALEKRLKECKLRMHPKKTQIVYCKDGRRREKHEHEGFEFLGYAFRARKVKLPNGRPFTGFNPGVSNSAKKKMGETMRKWKLHLRTNQTIEQLAKGINPVLRGWMNYYGKYYQSALRPILAHLNEILVRWVRRKYKRYRRRILGALKWIGRFAEKTPNCFAHWKQVMPTAR